MPMVPSFEKEKKKTGRAGERDPGIWRFHALLYTCTTPLPTLTLPVVSPLACLTSHPAQTLGEGRSWCY
ncbi:hypothetical protein IAQ61_011376, partial [Plenodomus lingam]|uniref:uncharacterized protein n=1 Tax=Leptosphaeria maculans TaxID=5022 RepID=UPI00331669C5